MRKKKSVILFFPRVQPKKHRHEFPLSIMALAPKLMEGGYDVHLIDERVTRNAYRLAGKLLPEAICVGISTMTGFQISKGIQFARFVRENSEVPIVWGGWHVSLLPEESVRSEYVDYVVRGQGEGTFAELVDMLQSDSSVELRRRLSEVSGIVYKDGDRVVSTPARELIDPNDAAPMPYSLIPTRKYYPKFSYLSSIGCPMSCAFCADAVVYHSVWRGLRAERMIDEIISLSDTAFNWRTNTLSFVDSNFFVNKNRVVRFCEGMIGKKMKLRWEANGHPHQMARYEDEFYDLISRSGCYRILIGAESGSQAMLDYINKRTAVEDLYAFVEKTAKFRIVPNLSMMCGMPGAPLDDLKDTILFMNEAKRINPKAKIKLFFFAPYPGSHLYDVAVKNGFVPPTALEGWASYTLNNRNMPYLDTEYENLVRWFVDKYYPRRAGKKKITWEEVVDEYNRTK